MVHKLFFVLRPHVKIPLVCESIHLCSTLLRSCNSPFPYTCWNKTFCICSPTHSISAAWTQFNSSIKTLEKHYTPAHMARFISSLLPLSLLVFCRHPALWWCLKAKEKQISTGFSRHVWRRTSSGPKGPAVDSEDNLEDHQSLSALHHWHVCHVFEHSGTRLTHTHTPLEILH